jgi:alcohol dehydrogenase class IV
MKKDFLSILDKNMQAQIAAYYNIDKTDEEKKIRNVIINEYKDLIAIYKSNINTEKCKHHYKDWDGMSENAICKKCGQIAPIE